MKRRVLIIALLLLLGVGGWLVWRQRPAAVLRRQVNFWVQSYRWSTPGMSYAERAAAQKVGLCALGTNAVPLLVEDLELSPGRVFKIRRWIRNNAPGWIGRAVLPQGDPSLRRRREAAVALQALGPEARAAVPALLRVLGLSESYRDRDELILALGAVGVGSARAIMLLSSATDDIPQESLGPILAISFWRLQPNNASVWAPLYRATNPPVELSAQEVWRAAEVLAEIGPPARGFTPWLQAMLTSQPSTTGPGAALDPYFPHGGRWRVALALWKIETNAEPALYAFRSFTNAAGSPAWPAQVDSDQELCLLARELSEIPEFCAAVRPLLETMDVRGREELARFRSNALQRVERTLRASRTKAAPTSPSPP